MEPSTESFEPEPREPVRPAATPASVVSLPSARPAWPRRYAVRIQERRGYDYHYTVTTSGSEESARRLAVANHRRGPSAIEAVTLQRLGPAPRGVDGMPILVEGDLADDDEFTDEPAV